MGVVGGVEDGLALSQHGGRLTEVNHGRRQHAEAGMSVVVVVPGEEYLAVSAAV